MWSKWGSYYNIPKAIFYLLKGDYIYIYLFIYLFICTYKHTYNIYVYTRRVLMKPIRKYLNVPNANPASPIYMLGAAGNRCSILDPGLVSCFQNQVPQLDVLNNEQTSKTTTWTQIGGFMLRTPMCFSEDASYDRRRSIGRRPAGSCPPEENRKCKLHPLILIVSLSMTSLSWSI